MNAQHMIGQISDKIFHSDFSDHDSALDSENKYTPDISDLISLSLENNVAPALISNEALDKPMLDIVNRFKNDDEHRNPPFESSVSSIIVTFHIVSIQ